MARVTQIGFNFTANNQFSPWIMHDIYEPPFDVTLAVYFGFGLNATLAVQFAVDDLGPGGERGISISQAVNTITVVDPGGPGASPNGPGLAVGDFYQLRGSPNIGNGTVDGGYNVTAVTNNTTFTLTSAVSQTLSSSNAFGSSGRVFTHTVLTGLIARAVSNYAFPVKASRLIDTAFTTGGIGYLVAIQGGHSS